MWNSMDPLAEQLTRDLQTHFPTATHIAITMTGELADCFLDRSEGVEFIVGSVQRAAECRGIESPRYYQVDGRFVMEDTAIGNTDWIAASNWHASASWIANHREPGSRGSSSQAMVLDIGSTTTDIIPINASGIATQAKTDFDRLAEGSLLYIGCSRTPLCALVNEMRLGDQSVDVMNEVFATTDDVWILLGLRAPDENSVQTADGKPRTLAMAANRMARMIGLDHRDISIPEAKGLARQVLDEIDHRIGAAMKKIDNGGTVFFIGQGASEQAWVPSCVGDRLDLVVGEDLEAHRGESILRVYPAYAVSKLLERFFEAAP